MKTFLRVTALVLIFCMLFSFSSFAAAEPEEKLNYLMMGDSIAEGFGVQNPDEASYGAIVANTNGYNYANIARYARTTKGLLNQIDYDESARELIADADIISLSIGGNDYFTDDAVVGIAITLLLNVPNPTFIRLEKQMRENFAQVIAKIRELNPDALILLQTLYSSWYGLVGIAYARGVATVNDMISDYLEENPGAYEVVDVASVMNGRKDLLASDTIHPNAQGNIEISKAVLKKLKDLCYGTAEEPVLIAEGIEYDYFEDIYEGFLGKFITFLVRFATANLF